LRPAHRRALFHCGDGRRLYFRARIYIIGCTIRNGRAPTWSAPTTISQSQLTPIAASRYEAAHADFAAAYAEDDEDYDALYGRGVAAVKLGRQAEGEADIAAAREESLGNQLEFYVNAGLRP
jgi:hypothetical protein